MWGCDLVRLFICSGVCTLQNLQWKKHLSLTLHIYDLSLRWTLEKNNPQWLLFRLYRSNNLLICLIRSAWVCLIRLLLTANSAKPPKVSSTFESRRVQDPDYVQCVIFSLKSCPICSNPVRRAQMQIQRSLLWNRQTRSSRTNRNCVFV